MDDIQFVNDFYTKSCKDYNKKEIKDINFKNSYYLKKAKEESKLINFEYCDCDKYLTRAIPAKEIKNLPIEERKKRRREQNKLSRRLCNERKKMYIDILEYYIVELEQKVNELSK